MIGVQLIGKQSVLDAFEKFDSDVWGIYQGKQSVVFGTNGAQLAEWLECFDRAGSTATYTLRVYEPGEPLTSVTGNNGYIACLNFKLVDMYEGHGIAGHTTKLLQRIDALEKKVDEGEPDDEIDINNILMGWLENPEKLGMVAGAVKTIFGVGGGTPAVSGTGTTISGFDANKPGGVMQSEDKLTRLSVALDELDKHDRDLVVHMEKLAKLAASDPAIFKAVITKLDAL